MKRIAPLFALALLSAGTAEFLLGDQYLRPTGPAMQLGMVVFFMAFYGTAAVLIRETARRLRLGWPAMLIMAFGFGVFEEGLITQSLFNPHYLGLDLLAPGYVPALGIGLQWTVYVITLHVIWSMSAPIALFESIFGSAPRLRRAGLIVVSVIFVLGAAATFAFNWLASPDRFIASPMQLAAAAVIVLVAVVGATRLPRIEPAAPESVGPAVTWRRMLAGVCVGALATTAFQLGGRNLDGTPDWVPTVAMIAALVVGGLLAGRFRLPATGLAAGAILTYGWVGLGAALAPHLGADLVEQSVIVAAYLALLVLTIRLGARSAMSRYTSPTARGGSSAG